jgi:hypothetical protein
MTAATVLAVSLVLTGGVALPAPPATAATVPTADPGELTPPLVRDTLRSILLPYVDAEHVVMYPAVRDQYTETPWEVRRQPDGALVREIVKGEDEIWFRDGAVFRVSASAVVAESLATGRALWTVPLEPGDQVLDVSPTHAVVRAGSTAPDGTVVVVGPEGARRTVVAEATGAALPAGQMRVAHRDVKGFFLGGTIGPLWRVSIDDAVARLAYPDAWLGPTVVVDDRLYWSAPAYNELRWVTTDGEQQGRIPFPSTNPFWSDASWPESLVMVGGAPYAVRGATVRPLTIGDEASLGEPVRTDANHGLPVSGSDSFAFVVLDGPEGRVVATRNFVDLAPVVKLPGEPALPSAFAISDTFVAADLAPWNADSPKAAGSIWLHARGADAGWAPASPLAASRDGDLVDVAGDALLLKSVHDDASGTWRSVVRWPEGERTITTGTPAALGRGGRYVIVFRSSGAGTEQLVEEARSGAVVATVPPGTGLAVDHDTAWTLSPGVTTATALDLRTGARTAVPIGTACAREPSIDARGRWVLVRCGGATRVADSLGVYDVQTFPASNDVALGNAFVTTSDAPPPGAPRTIVVAALDGSGTARQVGPVHGLYTPPYPGTDVDDSGRTIAFRDGTGRIRTYTPEWLPPAATAIAADTAAPTVTSVAAGPATTPTRTVTFTWSASDGGVKPFAPSGVASYDVELRQAPAGSTTYGPWTTGVSSTTATTWSITAGPGVSTCFRARATDRFGNVGAWSTAAACSRVDGTAPTFRTVPSVPTLIKATAGKATVSSSYSASDDVKVTSYDVRYRVTPKGQPTAPWLYPAALQKTTVTTASLTVGTGTLCVSARARDAVGNTSAWTTERCGYVDGSAPRITAATASPTAGEWAAFVNFTWAASDDHSVASYDVQYRKAPANGPLGAWTWALWGQGTTRTSLAEKMLLEAGQQACFRVRARDKAGNVSAWSTERCAYRERFAHDSTTVSGGARVVWDSAHLRKLVAFPVVGARATSRVTIPGRGVSVVALTGPRAGTLDVYSGSTRIGTVSLTSSTTTWKRFTITKTFSGTISFRSTSSRTSYVRSWTVIR